MNLFNVIASADATNKANESATTLLDKVQSFINQQGVLQNILYALLILIAGFILSSLIASFCKNLVAKTKKDETLAIFVRHFVKNTIRVFVIIAALSKLGIPTASFVAIVGALGLAIGLAFQGALSNLAAGLMLVIFRPFKVKDLIEAAGKFGVVEEIELFTTTLTTLDKKTIIVPNSKLTGDVITNYTLTDEIRVDLVFSASYTDDIDKVKNILLTILNEDTRVMKDPAPFVGVLEHAESSIQFACRPHVNPQDYWDVYFDVTEKVKKAFDQNNITIPFPQQDVHLIQK